MKTQPFNAYIKTLQYKKIEKESKFVEPVRYAIQANLLECKKGMARGKKQFHNALIFISEEEYNNRELKVMDKININENAQWVSQYHSLAVYDENKLKDYDNSQLKKDEKGRTFAKINFNGYTLKVQKEDWKMIERADEICYIQCGKVKFYIDETEIDNDVYCFFFDKNTFDQIESNNMQTFEMNCYLHKQKKWRKLIELQSAFDDESGRYFANLIVKEAENG